MIRPGPAAGGGGAAAMEQDADRACLQSFELHESESVSLPMRALRGCVLREGNHSVRPPDRLVDSVWARVRIRPPLLGILSVRVVRNCHFASIRANCFRVESLVVSSPQNLGIFASYTLVMIRQ